MTKFTSPFAGLLLQDGDGIWAKFEGGAFETDDPATIERLRHAQDVSEVVEAAPPRTAKARTKAPQD